MLEVIRQIPEEVGPSYSEFWLAVPTGSTVALRYDVCVVPLDMVLQHTSKFTFSYKNVLYTKYNGPTNALVRNARI
jgi:hypothetical protein